MKRAFGSLSALFLIFNVNRKADLSTLKLNYYLVHRNRATPCSSLHNIERILAVYLLLQLFRMSKESYSGET